MDLDRNESPVRLGHEFMACLELSGTRTDGAAKHSSQLWLLGRDHRRDGCMVFVPGLLDGVILLFERRELSVKRVRNESPFRNTPITIDLAGVEHIPRSHSSKLADKGRRQGIGGIIFVQW